MCRTMCRMKSKVFQELKKAPPELPAGLFAIKAPSPEARGANYNPMKIIFYTLPILKLLQPKWTLG